MTAYDDDSLLARLHAADPAATLPPADPDRVAHLLEAAMTDTTARPVESRENGTHGRSPLTWLVAAASVVLIAAAGGFALANRDHDSAPVAGQTVTQLGVTAAPARCMVPNVGVLRVQTIAFHGTLTTLESGVATFSVDHWFTGGPTDVARVSASPTRLDPLVRGAHFRVGGSYLVSASGGMVTGCGFSGPDTGRLATLYDQAFGG